MPHKQIDKSKRKVANTPEKYSLVIRNDGVYVIIQYKVVGFSKNTPYIVYKYDADNEKLVQICTFYMPDSIRQYRPLIYKALPLLTFAVATGAIQTRVGDVETLSENTIDQLVNEYRCAYVDGSIDNNTSFYPI